MAKNSLEKARLTINLIDKDMAELFERRMCAVREVAEYKKEKGMPILDRSRERQVVERGASYINDEGIKALYVTASHNMANRIIELAVRYEYDLPWLAKEAEVLEAKVKAHLERMGFEW